MTEHLSNGQFAKKEITEGSVEKQTRKNLRGGLFQKGGPGGPGRKLGVPNKTTRAVKEFLAELVDDTEVQGAVKGRIIKGDAVAFFRALEQVVGKPKENLDVTHHAGPSVQRILASVARADGKPTD